MSQSTKKVRVLMVCLGNICRSPTAEAVFREVVSNAGLSSRIDIDSAGTAAYHIGKAPDPRSIAEAASRGYDLSSLRARQAVASDFEAFDYVLAMDSENLSNLQHLAKGVNVNYKLKRFLSYSSCRELDVPDPYYGGPEGFTQVLDLIEQASIGLLEEIRQEYGL
ncbi:MAG: low molecular weight protein-tyrosine-phosphatase [Pontibacterium sp.]